MTRPLGASIADWLGKSRHAGGLGYGDGPVAFVLLLLILALVGFVAATGRDSQQPVGRPAQDLSRSSTVASTGGLFESSTPS